MATLEAFHPKKDLRRRQRHLAFVVAVAPHHRWYMPVPDIRDRIYEQIVSAHLQEWNIPVDEIGVYIP